MDHYQTLGVSMDASFTEIRNAYKKLALKHHPDRNRRDPEAATERMQAIQNAYNTLIDPDARNRYDLGLEQPGPQPSTSFAAPQPFPAEPRVSPFERFTFPPRQKIEQEGEIFPTEKTPFQVK
jgi:curved DNA-binding protein CbpA